MDKPLISIIIPTKNREKNLVECLISLSKQNFNNYEILIIDDNSDTYYSGDTMRLIDNLFYNKCKLYSTGYSNHDRRGPARARNIGIENSQGEILLFLNDDIIINDVDFLRKHLSCYNDNRVNAVLGHTEWDQRLDKYYLTKLNKIFRYYLTEISGHQFAYFAITNDEQGFVKDAWKYFYTCNVSVKKSFIEYFDESFPYPCFEDIELGFRLWNKGMNMLYQKNIVIYHNHDIYLKSFCERQIKAGKSAVIFMDKHSNIQLTNETDKTWFEKVKANIENYVNSAQSLETLDYNCLDKVKVSEKHTIGELNCLMLYGLWDIILKYYFLKGVFNE